MYSSVPGACLSDPSVHVCQYDEASYPSSLVDTVLQTYQHEMRVLLKYARTTMTSSTTMGLTNTSQPEPRGHFLCSVESKVVRPGWVRNADTGLWSVVIQSQLWDIDQVVVYGHYQL